MRGGNDQSGASVGCGVEGEGLIRGASVATTKYRQGAVASRDGSTTRLHHNLHAEDESGEHLT